MRFDRAGNYGFSLLEALISFAIVTLVLTISLPVFTNSAARQAERLQRLHASEFAVSILEEYRMTYPLMAASGTDSSGWAWTISERKIAPDGPTSLDGTMHLVQLSMKVWHQQRPESLHEFVTVVARPGS